MGRVWYCANCGYEVASRGRCHACREKLVASDLPELEPGAEEDEVGYRLGGWADRDRGRLIEYLNALSILHRFEDDELVVGAQDEQRVDDLIADLMASSEPDPQGGAGPEEASGGDFGETVIGEARSAPLASLDRQGASVALLADAARRLRADPTDMQADADVAEASAGVFMVDEFYGVDAETWAAVGRVTRKLLSALGAEEALEEEIRVQAAILAKLLEGVELPPPAGEAGEGEGGEHRVASATSGQVPAVGTVYELPEWMPEQRAHLGVLLDERGIAHGWDGEDLVVDSAREAEAESLFELVGAPLGPEGEPDADEALYQVLEELFDATGRLVSAPEDPQRRAEALQWAAEVDVSVPEAMDEALWLRLTRSVRSFVGSIEEGADPESVAAEASALHELLKTIV